MKLLFVFLLFLSYAAYSQESLDSMFSTLNNKDVFVAPVLYNPWEHHPAINKDSMRLHKRIFTVSSLPNDIRIVVEKYSKQAVVEKLYNLLSDTARDFYANILLYDLLDNRKVGKLSSMPRRVWVESGRKQQDYEHWSSLVNKTGNH